MEVEEIVEELKYYYEELPREALNQAIVQKEKVTPELLKMLEYTQENLKEIYDGEDEFYGYTFAIFLLAQFREKKAFPFIIELLQQPEEVVTYILGDDYPENLPRILASIYNGDDEALFKIIEDNKIDEFIRSSVLQAFSILYIRGEKTRDFLVNYLIKLLKEKRENDKSYLYAEIFTIAYDLRLTELESLINKTFEAIEDVREIEGLKKRFNDDEYKIHLTRHPFNKFYNYIDNAVEIMEEWECFRYDEEDEFENSERYIICDYIVNKRNEMNIDKIGRNDLCFCGSGKKYKKCCMNKNIDERLELLEFIDWCVARAYWYEEKGMIKREIKELRSAWLMTTAICRDENIKTIEEFDKSYEGYDFLSNWIQNYDNLLNDSNEEDYLIDRIYMCEDAKEIFELNGYWDEHLTRSLANSYYRLGERKKAENLIKEYLQKDPNWGWGYIEMCDWYLDFEEKDYKRAKEILEAGLKNERVRDKEVLEERLEEILDKCSK